MDASVAPESTPASSVLGTPDSALVGEEINELERLVRMMNPQTPQRLMTSPVPALLTLFGFSTKLEHRRSG